MKEARVPDCIVVFLLSVKVLSVYCDLEPGLIESEGVMNWLVLGDRSESCRVRVYCRKMYTLGIGPNFGGCKVKFPSCVW
jgi:hypothetical protein